MDAKQIIENYDKADKRIEWKTPQDFEMTFEDNLYDPISGFNYGNLKDNPTELPEN